jgi:hypothetical protein
MNATIIDSQTLTKPTPSHTKFAPVALPKKSNIAGVCERLGAIEAHTKMPASDRERSSPSTLVQMFLLWRHQVATLDRRSFGSIGSEGQHYLRLSIATALDDLKIGLERIRSAASDVDGFQQFIQEGEHLC